jgi:hypothetical protein
MQMLRNVFLLVALALSVLATVHAAEDPLVKACLQDCSRQEFFCRANCEAQLDTATFEAICLAQCAQAQEGCFLSCSNMP